MPTAAAEQRSDPWEMALIHRLIICGFSQAREFVQSRPTTPSRVPAVAEYVRFHLDGLHAHHSTEDELLWPALHERASLSDALIDRMERQHAGISEAVRRTRERLEAWTAAHTNQTSDALAEALGEVSDRLAEHLAEEERDIVPIIAEHITQREWEDLGKRSFDKFSPGQRFTAMGEMISAATPAESARMLASLPAPIRVVWRLVGRRRYDRLMAQVRG